MDNKIMKKLTLLLLISAPMMAQTWGNIQTAGNIPSYGVTTTGSACGTGYAHYRTYTVATGQVTGTQSNLPILLAPQAQSVTSMATVANGGSVQSSSGYDIIVCTAASGGTQIPHELVSYTASTGAFEMWFKPANVAQGSVYYIFYGNASAGDTSSRTGVWSNGYVGVWHTNDTSFADSTSNANAGTNHGTTVAAGVLGNSVTIGTGANSNYVDLPHISAYDFGTGDFTVSFYMKVATFVDSMAILGDGIYSSGWTGWHFEWSNTNKALILQTGSTSNAVNNNTYPTSNTSWTRVAGRRSGTTIDVFQGTTKETFVGGGTSSDSVTVTASTMLGRNPDTTYPRNFPGYLDEVRLSNVARSDNWLTAEFNSYSAATFYTLGTEQ